MGYRKYQNSQRANVNKANVCCVALINTCVNCTKLNKAVTQILMLKIFANELGVKNSNRRRLTFLINLVKYVNRVISSTQKDNDTKYAKRLMTACSHVLKTGQYMGLDLK